MRVLLVSSNSGSRGGGEIYLVHLARGLLEQGCEVTVMLDRRETMDELVSRFDSRTVIYRQDLKPTYERSLRCLGAVIDRAHIRTLVKEFGRIEADVIHLNQQVAEDGLDHLLAARQLPVPHLSTIHITHSPADLLARFGPLRTTVARGILARGNDSFITVSRQCTAQLSQWTGISADRIRTVHNGVPVTATSETREEIANRHGIPKSRVLLLCVGRLEAQKSPLLALEIMTCLAERGVRAHLLWVGDGRLRERFELNARQLEVDDRVTVTGWVDDPGPYFGAADIFMMPSAFEGLPLALLEAMHAGLPVISSRVDGIDEAVEDGVSGRLLSTRDPGEWAGAIARLIDDPRLLRRMGEAAQTSARERFSVESMSARTLALYRELAISRGTVE